MLRSISLHSLILILLICVPLAAVLTLVGWDALRTRIINRRIAALGHGFVESLIAEMAKVGNVPSTGWYLLSRPQLTDEPGNVVALPEGMNVSRLSGTMLRLVQVPDEKTVRAELLVGSHSGPTRLNGVVFGLVGIPRVTTKDGKGQNRYQPVDWIKRNPALRNLADAIWRRDPERALYHLCTFDRINSPFQWTQNPEYRTCRTCKVRLKPVMQISGETLGIDAEAAYYVMACDCQDGDPEVVLQFS